VSSSSAVFAIGSGSASGSGGTGRTGTGARDTTAGGGGGGDASGGSSSQATAAAVAGAGRDGAGGKFHAGSVLAASTPETSTSKSSPLGALGDDSIPASSAETVVPRSGVFSISEVPSGPKASNGSGALGRAAAGAGSPSCSAAESG